MTSWNLSSVPVCVFTDFIGDKAWRFPLDDANKTQPASATLRGTEPYRWMAARDSASMRIATWNRCADQGRKKNRTTAGARPSGVCGE